MEALANPTAGGNGGFLMYHCEQCKCVTAPGVPLTRQVTETRGGRDIPDIFLGCAESMGRILGEAFRDSLLAERATYSLFWGFMLLWVMWFVIGVCYLDATVLRMACACSVLNLLVAFNLNTIRKWFMTHWV